MNFVSILLCMSLLAVAVLATVLFLQYKKQEQHRKELKKYKTRYAEAINKANDYEARYGFIIDAEAEFNKITRECNQTKNQLFDLNDEYRKQQSILKALEQQIEVYQDDLELLDMGVYEPHFNFDTPEEYKEQINIGRISQKAMIKNGTAIYCETEWVVSNSKTEGKKMMDRAIKLTARAFNNECEAIISNVNWNNITRMQERMKKCYDDINKLNQTNQIVISDLYLDLKLEELQLVYEYQEKLKQEKDKQAEIRQQMREEARLEQEIINAQKEEIKYQKLLIKAQQQAEKLVGEDLEKLNAEIQALQEKLDEAHQKNERAKSMAQQTKVGHVYVISNIGSFGENVYKIGMTRRLEPMERVYELGDASVPFLFDVHAMIYSEDAPALEKILHQKFANKRLNLVNHRKEFFRVSLDEIKNVIDELNIDAEFITIAEAQEYNQSKLIRQENQ